MSTDSAYFFDPEPDGLELIEIANSLRERGYSLTYTTKTALLMMEAKQLSDDDTQKIVHRYNTIP
jgi:hypothetical protein